MKTKIFAGASLFTARVGAVVALLATLSPFPARATINVISHWRMGEADPGAANGAAAVTLIDSAGTNNLTCEGNPLYSTDVSATASNTLDSTLSVDFTGTGFALGAGGFHRAE